MNEQMFFMCAGKFLVEEEKGNNWVYLWVATDNKKNFEQVKAQIEKGKEARGLLSRLEEFYKKEKE